MKNAPKSILVLVIGLASTGAVGCNKQKETSAETSSSTEKSSSESETAKPASDWIRHKASGTKFRAPEGWSQKKDDDTILFVSPEKKAVLAFETYPAGTDPGRRIMNVAQKLRLDNLDWKGGTKEVRYGKDAIPARIAEGTCSFGGEQAAYEYATLNPGGPQQILILYAVQKSAPAERHKEAIEALKSLQKS